MAAYNQNEKSLAIIKLAIVDDHILFRSGMVKLIKGFGHMRVVVKASNGKQLLELLGKMQEEMLPDIVLMDLEMPELDGKETTKALDVRFPSVRVIALTQYDDTSIILGMIKAGAKGYLLKTALPEDVEDCIWMVYEKGSHFTREIMEAMQQELAGEKKKVPVKGLIPEFASRETEVLRLMCMGMTCKEIAVKLNKSVNTVEKQRKNVLKKSGCANTVELAAWAIRLGLVE